tara:strand:- start:15803 stop:16180 length:378 start_codon:yes stop_codon:yes gene_type:complete
MKKADNIVYNYNSKTYDAFKKNYPTSFNSKNFEIEKINNLKIEARPYFEKKFLEIRNQYLKMTEKLKWNEIIFNSKCNFNPIIGNTYYLYKKNNEYFLSIIKPKEWNINHQGTFILESNHSWKKI